MLFNKAKIKSNFNRFSHNYNSQANLQKQVAQNIFHLAKSEISKSQNILDLGSGSAFIAQNILNQKETSNQNIFQLDIALNMLKESTNISDELININADIENLPFNKNSFDVPISSLAFQWLNSLDSTLKGIKNIMKDESSLFFSVFLDETLCELKDSSSQLGLNLSVNNFISHKELENTLSKNFKDYKIIIEDFILEYDDIYHLLASIKNIGASYSQNNSKKALKRKDFDNLNKFYLNKFNINGTMVASWKVAYVKAK